MKQKKVIKLTESDLRRIISEQLNKNTIKEESNNQGNTNYDDGLLSLHLVRDYDEELEKEILVRYITYNSFDGGGFRKIKEITNSELRHIKSKGIDIDDEFNKKELHNILKDILTDGLSPKK
jgi:hypothetical protein